MYTEKQVIEALKHVIHPEKKENIIKMGMVENVKTEGKKISFELVFDRSNNPLISSIRKACVLMIKEHLGKDAEIEGNIDIRAQKIFESKSEVLPGVKNIVAVASGKGGVGKSTIAANLAVALSLEGHAVGLLDADIFGPSIPKMFGLEDYRPQVVQKEGAERIIPASKLGVKILSIGFFVDPDNAVVWRGPMASNFLKQLIEQGEWGELDYLLIDLPPGTSDIHLTMVQELSVTGAVIVSTPQDVALADAIKGISMFRSEQINVPVLGMVENMAWFTPEELPDNKYYIFGKEGARQLAEKMQVPLLGQIPLVQGIREGGDSGNPSAVNPTGPTGKAFAELAGQMVVQVEERNKKFGPTRKVEITNK